MAIRILVELSQGEDTLSGNRGGNLDIQAHMIGPGEHRKKSRVRTWRRSEVWKRPAGRGPQDPRARYCRDFSLDPLFMKILQEFCIKQGLVVSEQSPYRRNPTVTAISSILQSLGLGHGFRYPPAGKNPYFGGHARATPTDP
jgi:hypothetical protein